LCGGKGAADEGRVAVKGWRMKRNKTMVSRTNTTINVNIKIRMMAKKKTRTRNQKMAKVKK
jgi:hypothetical protein